MQSTDIDGINSDFHSRRRRVCIIGAGLSGIRAAGLLTMQTSRSPSLRLEIVFGGRIHQSSRFGPLIGLGASWIHGTQHNPVVHLAEKARSTIVACGAVHSICDSNGVWLSRDTARHYYKEVWEILEMAMDKSREETASLPDSAKMVNFPSRR